MIDPVAQRLSLRIYQEKIIHQLRDLLRNHQSVVLRLATGAGKSVIAAFMALGVATRGKRVIFTCHRVELLFQISATFDRVGLSYGIIAAGFSPNPRALVQIASIDTLKRRPVGPCDLMVVDECHHIGAAGWAKVIADYKAQGTRIVGLTATPWRLSGEGLGRWFDAMAHGPEVSWLIENGYLSQYRVFAPPPPDLTGVHTKMGDFDRAEIEAAIDKPVLVGNVVDHVARVARGKKTVAYCVSRKHSEHVAASFNAAGIRAAHIDGETEPARRKSLIRAFAAGDIDVVTNCEILTEGVDLGALAGRDITIECIALQRPTKSLTLHLQMIGRGMRPKDDPAIILDHAGNCLRMRKLYGAGFPDDDFGWSLADRQKRKKKKADEDDDEALVDVRQCPRCWLCHKPGPICPGCGHVYLVVGRPITTVAGELAEIDRDALRHQQRVEQGMAKSLAGLIAIGKARGYKPAWALMVWKRRGNR